MDSINQFFIDLDQFLGSAIYFPFLLLGVGFFFTLYLGFPQIRYFIHSIKILKGTYVKPGAPGDTSHFQALTTALSGTVGTGNISGVALAIYLGGPAALFWMWVTAFLGMTTKFVEVTLAHKYREQTADGTMAGGPMYYMEKKLNMKWLAIIFAVATVISSFGSGNMPQINSIAVGLNSSFGLSQWLVGLVLAVILALVIIGGIIRIAKVAEKIVPTMALIYLLGALLVIFANLENIGPSFAAIFSQVFTGSAAVGGFLGASFAYAFIRGVNRGLFSNEAGQGSAPIAHASAKGKEPASEGMVSLLEPFIDTIIICTITGLVILSSGVWSKKHENVIQQADMFFVEGIYSDQNQQQKQQLFKFLDRFNDDDGGVKLFTGKILVKDGVAQNAGNTLIAARSVAEEVRYLQNEKPFSGEMDIQQGKLNMTEDFQVKGKSLIHSVRLTSEAFKQGFLGDYGEYIVSIGLLLFAFSTAIAWSYYGDRAMTYLFGIKSVLPYRVAYVLAFFIASFVDTTIIWNLAAVTVVLMTIPNLIAITFLHKDMKNTVAKYWENFRSNQAD